MEFTDKILAVVGVSVVFVLAVLAVNLGTLPF